MADQNNLSADSDHLQPRKWPSRRRSSPASASPEPSGTDVVDGKESGHSKGKMKIWKKMKKLGGSSKRSSATGDSSPLPSSTNSPDYPDQEENLEEFDHSPTHSHRTSQLSLGLSPSPIPIPLADSGTSMSLSSSDGPALSSLPTLPLSECTTESSSTTKEEDQRQSPTFNSSESLPAGELHKALEDSSRIHHRTAHEVAGMSKRSHTLGTISVAGQPTLEARRSTSTTAISPVQKRLGLEAPETTVEDGARRFAHRVNDSDGFPYIVTVTVISGHSLASRDSNGLSDPYVKIKIGSGYSKAKTGVVYKSLSPIWNESFDMGLYSRDEALVLRVYDKDLIGADDFMGRAVVTLSKVPLDDTTELRLGLEEPGSNLSEDLGYLMVRVLVKKLDSNFPASPPKGTLTARSSTISYDPNTPLGSKKISRRHSGSSRRQSATESGCGKRRGSVARSVLSVTLLSGSSLAAMDENGFSDPYCKFKLGAEKWKSRIINKTLNPEWKEKFELRMLDGASEKLVVQVFDKDYASKDDFMGSCEVDIASLTRDITHNITKTLMDGDGELNFLLTITGLKDPSEFAGFDPQDPESLRTDNVIKSYSLQKTAVDLQDVGILMVKVIKAVGLHAADIGGTSDPFVTIELGNSMVRTETVYKSLNPEWNKCFFLKVKDIHTVLDVVVSDEDRDSSEFLGRLNIPLLSMVPGETRWYALKDEKLRSLYKGQVLLQFDLVYNPVRASVRTFNPAEQKYLEASEKFSRTILSANLSRVAALVRTVGAFIEFINSLFLWKSKVRTSLAFLVFLVVVLIFDLWMVFAFLIGVFMYQYFRHNVGSADRPSPYELPGEDALSSDDEIDEKSQDKKGLKQRLQDLYNICLTVQNALDSVASIGERVKNTFNWTIPFQSWLALIVLTIAMVGTYLVPLRYLVLLWGINKFTKRLRKPNFIPNNELLDFLSRIPSDPQLVERSVVTAATLASSSPKPVTTKKKKKRQ